MNIYHFDRVSSEFLGAGMADPDPLNPKGWIVPAHSTPKQPPPTDDNEAAIFDVSADRWLLTEDYRGTRYWLPDGSAHEITALGIVPPAGALTEPPPPTLPDIKQEKRLEIEAARNQAERQGMPWIFPGSIGDVVQLRTERDITNVNGQVTNALVLQQQGITDAVLPFQGESNQTHMLTPAQMIALGQAVNAHIAALYQHQWQLKDQLNTAQTPEEIEAIQWSLA